MRSSLLFVQDADGGTLDDDQLTMIEVSPNTGWFTDRPVREAGQMATADFVSLWDEGATFDTDPPNADFTCQAGGDTVNVVVELSSPVVNGRTLSYDVVQVGDTPAGDFDCDGNAHLFIDSVSDQCWKATELRNLQGVDLSGCNLTSTSTGFYGQNLSGANLSGANLTGMTLNRSDLSGANLSGATDADRRGPDAAADLSETMIEDANLSDANLSDANLYGDQRGPEQRDGVGHRERQRHELGPRQSEERPRLTDARATSRVTKAAVPVPTGSIWNA